MNLISVDNISKYFADRCIFENISFGINSEQKIALIGLNGSGKSTLLKLLAKKELPDSGNISWNKDCNINYLPQLPEFNNNDTILNHIFNGNTPLISLIKEYEYLCSNPNNTEYFAKKLDSIILEMDKENAWHFESEIKSILSELGITNLNLKMNELSGGMLKKVALAQALIDTGNIIILDEPTNHLDIDTIIWLEKYLKKMKKALIMVTHDRYFLDNVCNVIFELDNKKLFTYKGNYSYYLDKKSQRTNELIKESERINNILKHELKWLRSGVKARTTKQKARKERIRDLQNKEQYKEIEKINISIQHKRLGKAILEIKNISKSFGNKQIIKPFDYIFKAGEKLGIVGSNGTGKSTFLKILYGVEKPDNGEIIKGENTHIALFDQMGVALDPEKRIINTVKEIKEFIKIADNKYISAGQLLERFLFPPNTHNIPVKKLSGGEKRRLQLIMVLMNNPNFLIFDEPTNDIDIMTLSVLEDFLSEYKGCVIVVSHDRYFMNRVTEHLLIFEGNGKIDEFPGNFDDYLKFKEKQLTEKNSNKPKINHTSKQKRKINKLTYKEKLELENIENEIEKLENNKTLLENELNQNPTDYEKLYEIQKKLENIENEIFLKMERWEYLEDKAKMKVDD
jgi:ATP-binding cassette subfamily F protein uup